MTAQPKGNYTDTNSLANVTVLGVQTEPKGMKFNQQDVESGHWAYDSSSKVLKVTDLKSFTSKGAWSETWKLEWT